MDWRRRIIRFAKDDDKKAAFFINVRDGLDEIFNFFMEWPQDIPTSHLVVFFNLEIPRRFLNIALRIKTSEDYLSVEDYEEIDSYVFDRLSISWYLYKDITDYRGIPVGKIFEYDFQKYLIPRIKNLEVIRKVIEVENIKKLIVIDDAGELDGVARLCGKAFNLPLMEISLNQKSRSALNLSSRFRAKLSYLVSSALDSIALKRAMRLRGDKGLILIDAKLFKALQGGDDELPFLRCPLERGASIRFNFLRQGSPYLSPHFRGDRLYSREWVVYKKRWENLRREKRFRDLFKYEGISIWAVVHKALSAFFLEGIPRIISNINMLERVCEVKKLKLAVLRNDVKELERTIILSLRLARIPSLIIQHGILAETNGHNILLADRFAAWGKAAVDWYARAGNSVERFEITGNPNFDSLTNWRPSISKEALCAQLNLDANKGIILFATQQINKFSSFWTNDVFLVMADKLLEAIQQLPDKQLIIKVDPYEDLAPYKDKISALSHNNAVAVKNIDIYTLIFLSDLVITLDSTVGLEAIAFDKPLVIVNLTKRKDRVAYVEKGAAIGVYEESNLTSAIRRTLTDQKTIAQLKNGRNSFLEEYAYKIDGKAKKRISNTIKYYTEN